MIKKLTGARTSLIIGGTIIIVVMAVFTNYYFWRNSVKLEFGTVKRVEWDAKRKRCHVELFGGKSYFFIENYEGELLVNSTYTMGIVQGVFKDRLLGYDEHFN